MDQRIAEIKYLYDKVEQDLSLLIDEDFDVKIKNINNRLMMIKQIEGSLSLENKNKFEIPVKEFHFRAKQIKDFFDNMIREKEEECLNILSRLEVRGIDKKLANYRSYEK